MSRRFATRPGLASALLGTLLVSCGGRATSVTAPAGGFADVGAAITTLELTRTELHPGDTTAVQFQVTNPTSQRMALHFTDGCRLMFQVTDSSGTLVAPETRMCLQVTGTDVIPPHGSIRYSEPWTATDTYTRVPLAPGRYQLRAELQPFSDRRMPPVDLQLDAR